MAQDYYDLGAIGTVPKDTGGSDMAGMAIGMIGSAAIGAAGSAASSGGGGIEAERLAKAQREQQQSETASYRAGAQPTDLIQEYMKRDMLISQQMGPAGTIPRLLNTADFIKNQMIPYFMQSNVQGSEYISQGLQGKGQNKGGEAPWRQRTQNRIDRGKAPILGALSQIMDGEKKNPMATMLGRR